MNDFITPQRFKDELKKFKAKNGIKSNEILLEKFDSQLSIYNREALSRFSSGTRRFHIEDIERFSQLFGIRTEYLSGLDHFRTEKDKKRHDDTLLVFEKSIHKILLCLGYADGFMEADDYNITFPENTKLFIENIKEVLNEQEYSILCSVANNTFITLSNEEYYKLLYEIMDFICFKFSSLFFKKETKIPDVITEDDNYHLHPNETIELKDGNTYTFDLPRIITI